MLLTGCALGDDILGGIDDLPEVFALERRLRDAGQVARGGVVALVVQTVGVIEMRVLAAERIGALVHHADKVRRRPCDILGYGVCRVVSGVDHHAVKKILERDLLADL